MPKMRNRAELCPHCGKTREVIVNLDDQSVYTAATPPECPHRMRCISMVRDRALLAVFEDGKTRRA